MQAQVGSWLAVRSHRDDQHWLRGEILSVGPDGKPPYRVRWLDDNHESLIFPGPDAMILSAEEQTALSAQRAARAEAAQMAMHAAPSTDAGD